MPPAMPAWRPAAPASRPLHPGFPSLFERSRAVARLSVLPALGLAAGTLLSLAGTPAPSRAESPVVELRHASLEELLNLHVSSASKKEERIWDTDAAVEVITSEAIRRSGATCIPDLLRMVPGVSVAQIDANKWSISARGFSGRFADKMLVLIDGRSVYSPSFSGVYWDVQDLLLEDIERIEVIRGPGGTLWGANAVNGVINILTKNSESTRGRLVTGGFGSVESGFAAARAGATLGPNASLRVYAKYFDRDGFDSPGGQRAADRWGLRRGGFRSDFRPSGRDLFMLEGEAYNGDTGQTSLAPSLTAPFMTRYDSRNRLAGENALGRWTRALQGGSTVQLQLYYDRTRRVEAGWGEIRNTFDVDSQHHFAFGRRHDVVWGLGYRASSDRMYNSPFLAFAPERRTDNLFSGFAQDQISLQGSRLRLSLGTKLERNDYSGFEVQPSGRLLWSPAPRHSLWGAISHADRTPSRADLDVRAGVQAFPDPSGMTALVMIVGNRDFRSERVLAYEMGYRVQARSSVSFDVAAFHNRYRELRTTVPGTPYFDPNPVPHVVIPLQFSNALQATSSGVEAVARWTPARFWKLTGSYSWLDLDYHDPGNVGGGIDGDDPRHQLRASSNLDLPHRLELDTSIFYASQLERLHVPAYTRLDARLGAHLGERLEASLVGQNLMRARHVEMRSVWGQSEITEVQRSGYAKLACRF